MHIPLTLHPEARIIPKAVPAALTFSPDHPWLAPLAGYTDLPFRLLCREYGASVCCSEMISAKGLLYHSAGTEDLLLTLAEDQPFVVQLFGSEPDSLSRAMEPLLERGFRWFDLNMGCPVPKVVRTGCGAAMLKNPENAFAVARAMIETAGAGHVGFKIRLGWEPGQEVWRPLAEGLQNLGAGWITLHPRYARQGFSGTADWNAIAALAGTLRIPVIASGDLLTAEDGIRCLRETGAATVMYARGAMSNPGIFAEHARLRTEYAQSGEKAQPPAGSSGTAEYGQLRAEQVRHGEKTPSPAESSGAAERARHGEKTPAEGSNTAECSRPGGKTRSPATGSGTAECGQLREAAPARTGNPDVQSPASSSPGSVSLSDRAEREQLRDMIRRHAALARAYSNGHTALFKMRTFVPRYVHAVPGVRALRQKLGTCTDWASLDDLLYIFLSG